MVLFTCMDSLHLHHIYASVLCRNRNIPSAACVLLLEPRQSWLSHFGCCQLLRSIPRFSAASHPPRIPRGISLPGLQYHETERSCFKDMQGYHQHFSYNGSSFVDNAKCLLSINQPTEFRQAAAWKMQRPLTDTNDPRDDE